MPHSKAFLDKRKAWQTYHEEHPEVFGIIDQLAQTAYQKGVRQVSIWLLAGQLRWSMLLAGNRLKVGNDHLAFYARFWMALDPKQRGAFFTIRRAVGEDYDLTRKECGIKF